LPKTANGAICRASCRAKGPQPLQKTSVFRVPRAARRRERLWSAGTPDVPFCAAVTTPTTVVLARRSVPERVWPAGQLRHPHPSHATRSRDGWPVPVRQRSASCSSGTGRPPRPNPESSSGRGPHVRRSLPSPWPVLTRNREGGAIVEKGTPALSPSRPRAAGRLACTGREASSPRVIHLPPRWLRPAHAKTASRDAIRTPQAHQLRLRRLS
jgi:hypothetical protein